MSTNTSPISINLRSNVRAKTTNTTNNNTKSEMLPEESSSNLAITQDFLIEQISNLKEYFKNGLLQQKNDIVEQLRTENKVLRDEIDAMKEKNQEKDKFMLELEKDVINLQQYVRRNNVEICGIPNSIDQDELQDKVIEIAKAIGVEFSESDVEACHRLYARENETKKTIVRFVNKKNCDLLHANKFKLKDSNSKTKKKLREIGLKGNIFINFNLSPYMKFLWGKCKRLHSKKMINRFWVFNGNLFIVVEENDQKIKIDHFDKLSGLFPTFNFNADAE
ncbi:uncharacterized protein LOC130613821 [Hydractinia symbiolongicarpus]|uniref:uncharacterized protein LOC130613821 n=1 Tax=Hydractinia symbiolongicarpus TaxID=13093 RepID=UPI00254A0C61|nr:uncharacterized protein LOC130613821 [Hydractinia symbiolongicarpus]